MRSLPKVRFVAALALAGAVLFACESAKKVGSRSEVINNLSLLVSGESGMAQKVAPRGALPQPFVFDLRDGKGTPQQGVTISFCLIDVTGLDDGEIPRQELLTACHNNQLSLAKDGGATDTIIQDGNVQAEDIVGRVTEATATTDNKGRATAYVKAPQRFNRKIAVVAHLGSQKADAGGFITFLTSTFGEAETFAIETSDGNKEAAGAPFEISVVVKDKDGYQVRTYDGTRTFSLKFDLPVSWAGKSAHLPEKPFSCVISGGRCTVPGGPWSIATIGTAELKLIDSETSDKEFPQQIEVRQGQEAEIILADRAGGTATGAKPVTSLKLSPAEKKFIAAAVTDAGGNFLRDATDAYWILTNKAIGESLPGGAAASFEFVSHASGSGELTAATKDVHSGAIPVQVTPGPHVKWLVDTQHHNTEVAGDCFDIVVKAVDSADNVNDTVEGNWDVQANLGGVTESGPVVNDTAHWQIQGTSAGRRAFITTTFTKGISTLPAKACLYDATSVAPKIEIEAPSKADSSVLITGSADVTLRLGPPVALGLLTAAYGQTGDNPCMYGTGAIDSPCIKITVDDTNLKYYSVLADKAGNALAPTKATWRVTGPLAALNNMTFNEYATISATTVGTGLIEMESPDHYTFKKYYKVSHGTPANYTVESEHSNTETATSSFAVKIKAYDQYNNFCDSFTGPRTFNFTLLDAAVSPYPKYTAPVAAFSETVTLTSGVGTTQGKLLAPLATTQPGSTPLKPYIRLTIQSNNFDSARITINAGAANYAQIRSAQSGLGSLVQAPIGIKAGRQMLLFIASYDTNGNYVRDENSTFVPTGVIVNKLSSLLGTVTNLSPDVTGVGTLTATPTDSTVTAVSLSPVNITSSDAESFKIETTHNLVETAGVDFNITIRARDHDLNTSVTYSGAKTLEFAATGTTSWGGQTAVLPSGNISCTFNAGVCVLSASGTPINYKIMDSRAAQTITVTDVGAEVPDVWAANITVTPGPATQLVITDKVGGPAAGAVPLIAAINKTADDSAITFAAAKVDSGGNYIADGGAGTAWTSTAANIANYISTSSGASTVFTPTKVVSGRLKASLAGLADGLSGIITVAPGVLAAAKITTQHNNVETAGVPFTYSLTLTDAHQNVLTAYDRNVGVNMSWRDEYTPPDTVGPGEFTDLTCVAPGICTTSSAWSVIPFSNGVGTITTHNTTLYDATNVTPNLHIAVNASGSFPSLDTFTNAITVNTGPADHISFMTTAIDDGHFFCNDGSGVVVGKQSYPFAGTSAAAWGTYTGGANLILCRTFWIPNGSQNVYAHIHDKGGNFLGLATGDWTIEQFTGTNFRTLSNLAGLNGELQNATGTSMVTMRNHVATTAAPGVVGLNTYADYLVIPALLSFTSTTGLKGMAAVKIFPGLATDFDVTVANPVADKATTIKLVLRDQYGNYGGYPSASSTTPQNLNVTLAWSSTPANSRKGTAPSLSTPTNPCAFTDALSTTACNISATLPLAGATGVVNVTVGSIATKAVSILPLPGDGVTYHVLTAGTQGASDFSAGASMPADTNVDFYTGLWDSEWNYAGSWLSSITADGALTGRITQVSGSLYRLTPQGVGTGNLVFTPSPTTRTLSTGATATFSAVDLSTVTIIPGSQYDFGVTTQHSGTEAAGTSFSVSVTIRDNKGNTVPFTGNKTLYWNLLNASANHENRTAVLHGQSSWPFSGTYAFVNGVMTTAVSATLYNSLVTPDIVVSTGAGGTGTVGSSGPTTVTAGAADHYGVYLSSPSYSPRADLTTQFTALVELRDTSGNRVSGGETNVQLTMVKSDGSAATGTLTGTKTGLNLTGGSALVTDLAWDAGGSFRLKADKAGGGTYTTPVTAGSVASTILIATPSLATVKQYNLSFSSPLTAGQAATIQVKAVDNSGSLVTGIDTELGALTFAWAGPHAAPDTTAASLPTAISFSGGQSAVPVTLYKAETIASGALTFNDNQGTPLTGASTSGLTVNAGALHHYNVTSSQANRNADTSSTFTLTVNAYDQWGNLRNGEAGITVAPTRVSGVANVGTLHGATVSGLNMAGASTLTLSNLYYLVPHTINFAITGGSVSTTNSDQIAFTATAESVHHYELVLPASATAGAANLAVTVKAKDEADNVLTSLDATLNALTPAWSGANTSTGGQAPSYGSLSAFSSGVATATHSFYASQTFAVGGLTYTDNHSPTRTGSNAATLTINPRAASALVLSASSTTVTAGSNFDITVKAVDSYGNLDTTYTTASLDFSWLNANASVTNVTSPRKLATAVRTFTSGSFATSSVSAGAFTLYNAYDSGVALHLISPPLPTSDLSFTVSPQAAVETVKIQAGNTYSSTDVTGTTVTIAADDNPATYYSHAYDHYGNYIGLYSVDWDGSGTGLLTASNCSSSCIVAPRSNSSSTTISPRPSGSGTLTAKDHTTTATLAQTTFTVNPGTPFKYKAFVENLPSTIVAGVSFNVIVQALDSKDNIATSYTGGHSLTFSYTGANSSPDGLATIKPATQSWTFTAGALTATGFTVKNSGDTFTVGVTGDLAAATSPSVTVTPATATKWKLAKSGGGTTITAGTGFDVVVTAQDPYGNRDTNYNTWPALTFTWVNATTSDEGAGATAAPGVTPSAGGSGQYTTSGAGYKSYRRTTAPFDTSVALRLSGGTLTNYDLSLTVSPAALHHIYILKNVSTISLPGSKLVTDALTADDAPVLYAHGFDQWGNWVALQSADWSSTGDFSGRIGASVTGVTNVTLNPTTVSSGSGTVTAQIASPSSTYTTGTITLTQGAAHHFDVSLTAASPVTAGQTFGASITVRDQDNNVKPNYVGTLVWSWGSAPNSPNSTAALKPNTASATFNASGVYSTAANALSLYSASTTAAVLTVSLSGSPAVTGDSVALAVNPGTATSLSVDALGSQTAGVAFTATAHTIDNWGNNSDSGCGGASLTVSCAAGCTSPGGYGGAAQGLLASGSPFAKSTVGTYPAAGLKLHKLGSNTVTFAACSLTTAPAITVVAAGPNTVYLHTTDAVPASGANITSVNCTAGATVSCPTLYAFAFDAYGNNISGTSWTCPTWAYVDGNSAPFNVSPYNGVTLNNTANSHSTKPNNHSYHVNGAVTCTVAGVTPAQTTLNLTTVTKTHGFTGCSAWACSGTNTATSTCTLSNSTSYDTTGYSFSGMSSGVTLDTSTCTAGLVGIGGTHSCSVVVNAPSGTSSGNITVTPTIDPAQASYATLSAVSRQVNSGNSAPVCP